MEDKDKEEGIEEIKKKIAIERLRQAPPNFRISLGSGEGKFMNRDDLIKEVERETSVGESIIDTQLEYLKAFKKGFLIQHD